MKTRRKNKFNIYILTLKQQNNKGNVIYKVKDWKYIGNVNRQLACYYIYKKSGSGQMMGLKDNKPCKPLNGDTIISIDDYNKRNIIFCVAHQQWDFVEKTEYHYGIHIIIPTIGLKLNKNFNDIFKKYLEYFNDKKNRKSGDYSIHCSCIWGPNNLIPKGYYHVVDGVVMDGDMYFENGYYDDLPTWTPINLSYSKYRIGDKIEIKRMVFHGGVNGQEKKNEELSYYSPFIIRKN